MGRPRLTSRQFVVFGNLALMRPQRRSLCWALRRPAPFVVNPANVTRLGPDCARSQSPGTPTHAVPSSPYPPQPAATPAPASQLDVVIYPALALMVLCKASSRRPSYAPARRRAPPPPHPTPPPSGTHAPNARTHTHTHAHHSFPFSPPCRARTTTVAAAYRSSRAP